MSIFHPFVYPDYRPPEEEDAPNNSPSIAQQIKNYIDYGLNKVVCGNEEDARHRKSVSFDATVKEAEIIRLKK
jgi:hypothetical protein